MVKKVRLISKERQGLETLADRASEERGWLCFGRPRRREAIRGSRMGSFGARFGLSKSGARPWKVDARIDPRSLADALSSSRLIREHRLSVIENSA